MSGTKSNVLVEELRGAAKSLADNRPAVALSMLLKAWRTHSLPQLADLIDVLDTRLPRVEVDGRSQRAWLDLARSASDDKLGSVLATLGEGTIAELGKRVAALGERKADPRVASVLLALVEAVPFTSNTSRPTWLEVFRVLTELGDPRAIARAEAAKKSWTIRENQREWMEPRLHRVIAALKARYPEEPHPTAAETEVLEGLKAALAAGAKKTAASASTSTAQLGDELLAAIYASPDDDGPRAVYADWLSEQGDPRGEFITLQLAAERGPETLAREKKLLAKHGKAWLGPLAPVVLKDGVVFERGFLSACRVRFRNEKDVREHGSHAAWATVRRLQHYVPDPLPDDQARWIYWVDPAMKSLREVDVNDDGLRALCEASVPWQIERLDNRARDPDVLAMLATTEKLPKLPRQPAPPIPDRLLNPTAVAWPSRDRILVNDEKLGLVGLDAKTGKRRFCFALEGTHNLTVAPDGQTLAVAYAGSLYIRRVSDGAKLHSLQAHGQTISALAFSPDGTRLVSASASNDTKIWDVASGACVRDHNLPHKVRATAWMPDGKAVVMGDRDKLCMVDLEDEGKRASKLASKAGHMLSVSKSGRIASASGKQVLVLAQDGTQVATRDLTDHPWLVEFLDEQRLLVGVGKTALILAADDAALRISSTIKLGNSSPIHAAVDPDRRTLAVLTMKSIKLCSLVGDPERTLG